MGVAGVSPTEEGGPQYEVTDAIPYEVKPGVYLVHEIHDSDKCFRHRAIIGVAHSAWMDYSSIAMVATVDGEFYGCAMDNWQPMFPPAFQVVSLAPSDPQPIKTLPFQPSATEPVFEDPDSALNEQHTSQMDGVLDKEAQPAPVHETDDQYADRIERERWPDKSSSDELNVIHDNKYPESM